MKKEMMKLNEIDTELKIENVTRAYAGRVGCMCGCRGNYKTAKPEHVMYSESEELSPRAVKMRFNKVMKTDPAHVNVDLSEDGTIEHVWIEENGRTTVLYFV